MDVGASAGVPSRRVPANPTWPSRSAPCPLAAIEFSDHGPFSLLMSRGRGCSPRSEAFYEADQRFPNLAVVKATREAGLRARVLDARTPPDVITQFGQC